LPLSRSLRSRSPAYCLGAYDVAFVAPFMKLKREHAKSREILERSEPLDRREAS
jgi:hypothetical protein